MKNNVRHLQNFIKIAKLKRTNLILTMNRTGIFKKGIEHHSQRLLKTMDVLISRRMKRDPLFFESSNKNKTTNKLFIVIVESFTSNATLINLIMNDVKPEDKVLVAGTSKEVSDKFVEELLKRNISSKKINIISTQKYEPTYKFAEFLEKIVRQGILIANDVSSVHLLARTQKMNISTKIAPLFSDYCEVLGENANGFVQEEDIIKDFMQIETQWVSSAVRALVISRILVKLLEKHIEEMNFEVLNVENNIDVINEKIEQINLEGRREKKKKSLNEINILNG